MAKTGKRGGGGKWLFLGGLVLAVVVAVEAGWAGFGLAQLRAAVWPRDEGLLAWIPAETSGVVIVDPHQLHLDSLGAEGSAPRTAIQRTRDDVKKATGIDIAFDVDKLALTSPPSGLFVVARGRFDAGKLRDRLAEHRYQQAEHEGVAYLVRAGADAIAVVGDSLLLYGDEASIKASASAHARGATLEKDEQTLARLKRLGWDHAVISTFRITDDRPSVREILSGNTGPRALSFAVSTPLGLDVDLHVEAASPGAADELGKLLDRERKSTARLAPLVGAEAAQILGDVVAKGTLRTDPATSVVAIHCHFEPAQIDALSKQITAGGELSRAYANLRLFQLLVPNR